MEFHMSYFTVCERHLDAREEKETHFGLEEYDKAVAFFESAAEGLRDHYSQVCLFDRYGIYDTEVWSLTYRINADGVGQLVEKH